MNINTERIKIKTSSISEPKIVYVSHKNEMGYWVCEVLNTNITVFAEDNDLLEYEYRKYMRILYDWRISNHDTLKENYIKMRNLYD